MTVRTAERNLIPFAKNVMPQFMSLEKPGSTIKRTEAKVKNSEKGLVAVCHSFCLFLYFITFIQYNHPITFIQYIRRGLSPSPHRLWLSGKDLPVVPSRESNSGLPSSKPTRYQLSHAAPFKTFKNSEKGQL
jgi:hypothetical protein